MPFIDYFADGYDYRIVQGWINSQDLTASHNVTNLPKQADQGRLKWIAPVDQSSDVSNVAQVTRSIGGPAYAQGKPAFQWRLPGLTPAMVYFLENDSSMFAGKFSQKFTVMTWDRAGQWHIYWVWGYRDRRPAMGESGFHQGYRYFDIDFVVEQVAPLGPDLTVSVSHTDPFTQDVQDDYTITVDNIGDGVAGLSIQVLVVLPASYDFVSTVASGWSIEYFESGMWVSSVGTPTNVTQVRWTYDSSLSAGATSSAITLTIDPTASGSEDLTATVTTSDDVDNGNNSDTDNTTIDAP